MKSTKKESYPRYFVSVAGRASLPSPRQVCFEIGNLAIVQGNREIEVNLEERWIWEKGRGRQEFSDTHVTNRLLDFLVTNDTKIELWSRSPDIVTLTLDYILRLGGISIADMGRFKLLEVSNSMNVMQYWAELGEPDLTEYPDNSTSTLESAKGVEAFFNYLYCLDNDLEPMSRND